MTNPTQKLPMHTPSLSDEKFAALSALFPNAITETQKENGEVIRAVDPAVLAQEINTHVLSGKEERYQFTWPDKRKSVLLANAPINAALRPCREESVDFDNTENLYIEGDNLDVLKLLRETYLNKVKMIYIDPPYNTSNDFIYNDDFSEDTESFLSRDGQYDDQGNRLVKNLDSNGRFHTDWLNMIYPRLRIARDLLTEDGIVIINMDENEIINLQKICIEIFGEVNDLGTIIWDKRNPKGDAKGISYQHENIVIFAKNKTEFLQSCKMVRPKKNAKMMLRKAEQLFSKIDLTYTLEQANSDFQSWISSQRDLSGGEKAYNRMDEKGDLYQAVSMAWPNNKKAPEDYFVPLIHPVTNKPCPVPAKGWRNPSSTMRELAANKLICFGSDETTQPRRKYLLKENMDENIPSLLYYGGSDTDMLTSMGIPFDTPKVVDIVTEHIRAFTQKGDIVLDFFSGSATTAHAVMQSNAEDAYKRKFIMVQIPEMISEDTEAYKAGFKSICELGKERIRQSGNRIVERQADILGMFRANNGDLRNGIAFASFTTSDEAVKRQNEIRQQLDVGFRVLKLDSSNMKDVYYTPDEYAELQFKIEGFADNIKEGREDEDLLFQVMLDLGIPLSAKIKQDGDVFNVNENYLIACFKKVDTAKLTEIAKQKPYYAVFRDSSFESDSAMVNFEQVFKTYSPDTIRRVL